MIPFSEALRVWCRVALSSFGGPAGQIAVMHRILVEEKHWISENRFLHALNYCMLLPGPEAQQLATYLGWLFHRTLGGLIAGGLFILPGFISVLGLSILYAGYRDLTLIEGLFYGLAPAVIALVAEAVFRIGRKILKSASTGGIAILAFVAIFFFDVPFPAIIAAAAAIGFAGGKLMPEQFSIIHLSPDSAQPEATRPLFSDEPLTNQVLPAAGRSAWILLVGLTLWFGPLLLLSRALGPSNVYVQEGFFFSKAAVVTFGGAYAVLAYMAQQAVEVYGWLEPGEMLDGLGMAETTPGPLIQVVQFVGFMGAYRAANGGELPGLDPLLAGALAAVLTTWVTFVPCFLWIFLGAPYVERLRDNASLSSAFSAITAAVCGVVLNLAAWFSLHSIFHEVTVLQVWGARILAPVWSSLDPFRLLVAGGALLALLWFKLGMIRTLAASVAVGALYSLFIR